MELRITLKPYCLPFRQTMLTAHGPWVEREGVLVRLEDESGRVGYGEAAPVRGFGGGTLAEVTARLGALGDRARSETLVEVAAEGGGVGFALGAALMAFGNAEAGLDFTPKHDYLPVAGLLPAGRGVLAAIEPKLELGFRTFKWKVGVGDPQDERGILDDLLSRLPTGCKLRLDANGAWDRRRAEAWLECCAERPMIEFVEQPVATGDDRGRDLMLGLAEDYPTVLALDEAVTDLRDLQRWADNGWRGVFVVKPALAGDPAALMAGLAERPWDVVFSTALETAIGARTVLTMAFAASGKGRALGTGVWPLFNGHVLNGPTAMPFVRWFDVAALNSEAAWNAAS
ncbi:o-succinylbenzoate synthase [Synoicihabitans lomoniglobus]|uniref:o-succinylbenzoate synthase n=1 Tax=Synoicihabitans lomoniglobus TaxID=2909285 RepID=A0AAF0I3I4_9BACT|nr:o-succinylbenzoate synthase [Opitutaceae bacterium LMO-M01]WED66328.1 o-succinylbenzoate synthase [Opitutaceae bacterium LMO-M01]